MWKAFKITFGIMAAIGLGYLMWFLFLGLILFAGTSHAEQCTTMTIWQDGKYKVCSVCPTGDGNVVVNCT